MPALDLNRHPMRKAILQGLGEGQQQVTRATGIRFALCVPAPKGGVDLDAKA